jgi:RHS repeat-associated protein
VCFLLAWPLHSDAQDVFQGEIRFGQTLGGRFDDSTEHRWYFYGISGDIVELTLIPTGGQFVPELLVITPNNMLLNGNSNADLSLLDGLPMDGEYTVIVSVADVIVDSALIANEYSLSLAIRGRHRSEENEGLSGLPQIPEIAIGTVFQGTSTRNDVLALDIFGDVEITQPNIVQQRNRFLMQGAYSVDLDNTIPISRGINAIAFCEAGVALWSATQEGIFFTDQNITLLKQDGSITQITLENGQTISTDFYRIQSLVAVNDLLLLTMQDEQQILLEGQTFEFLRRGGINGEGPNAEPVNILRFDGVEIQTDLMAWQTLALVDEQLRVFYSDGFRLLSDDANITLFQRGNSFRPELNPVDMDTSIYDIALKRADDALMMTVESSAIRDIVIANAAFSVVSLEGGELIDPLEVLSSIVITNSAIRFLHKDGSVNRLLLDQTGIETPNRIISDETALANQAHYLPRNFNNLGTHFFDYHPNIDLSFAYLPVNRVTGNFVYSVQDFYVPSHTLALDWTRVYNSQSLTNLTPDYMLEATYLFGQMGSQWRHSYQYELDITNAPLAQVRMILPDGSSHIFRSIDNGNLYRSDSLLSWRVEQLDSGAWQAVTTETVIYHFDSLGRLQRISTADGHSLRFSAIPQHVLEAENWASGFYVIESYGRRLEVFADETGYIREVRDPQQRPIRYDYAEGQLVHVQYVAYDEMADYGYSNGFLSHIEDAHSPYHPGLALKYDADGRIESYVVNPDGDVSFKTDYRYEIGSTTETQFVNGNKREFLWQYDNNFRLTGWQLPQKNWAYHLNYSPTTGRLAEFAQPDGSVLRFNFDEYGYLANFTDPQFGANGGAYKLSYATLAGGYQRLVTQVDGLNGNYVSLTYDDFGRVASVTRPFEDENGTKSTNTINYTYDSQGRVETINRPDAVTQYAYDEFAYVRSISGTEGLIWETRYDFVGRLLSISDIREGGKTSYLIWDDDHNQLERVSVGGTAYEYDYDAFGNLIQYRVDGREEVYEYNDLNQVVLHRDWIGREITYAYDELGNLLEVTDFAGVSTHYGYDALNFLTSRSSSNGLNITYNTSIDIEGTRTIYTAINSANEKLEYRYDSLGRIRHVSFYDRNGTQIANYVLSYSALGFLETVGELHVPGGRSLSVSYDVQGNPLSTTINNVATTRYRYDVLGHLVSVTDPEGRRIEYRYDDNGNITTVILADGREQFYEYNVQGKLIRYIDAAGGVYQYLYNDSEQMVKMIEPAAYATSYEYDEQGNIASILDANGNLSTFTYNAANLLTVFVDAEGNRTSYNYDVNDRLLKIIQPSGLVTDITYDAAGEIVAITQPSDREFLYGHNSLGRITSVTNPLGNTTLYAYNTLGQIGRITDPLGNESSFQWSLSRRVLSYSSENGADYTYNSDAIGRLTTINERGLPQGIAVNTRIEYDDSGYVTAVRRGTSGNINSSQAIVYRYTYDENGQLIRYQSPESDGVWRFAYDALGNLTLVSNPNGVMTRYDYDERGNLTVYPDFDAEAETPITESYHYDGNGNLIRYMAADGRTDEFTYNANNRLIERKTIAPDGELRTEQYAYDELGRVSLIRDINGQETILRYDVFGNLVLLERTLATDAEAISLSYRYVYDEVDNLRSIELPNGQRISMTYNVLNQRVRYIDAENNGWSYSYDSAGNISQISNPLGSLLSFDYDSVKRITQIAYATGGLVDVSYDALGNLSRITLPDTQIQTGIARETTDYKFDREGRLLSIAHTDRQHIDFERDDLGKITQMRNADATVISFAYDDFGHLIAIQSPEGEMTRSYDVMGRLIAIGQGEDTIDFAYDGFGYLQSMESSEVLLNYQYDNVGNLKVRDAGDYGMIDYEYDNLNRPIRVSLNDESVAITYNVNGWRTSLLRSDGFETRYVYDNNGRIRNIIHLGAEGQRLDGFAYEYDAAGNLARITRTDNWSVLYSYDNAQQLISERWLNPENQLIYSVTYSYDQAGNRVEQTTRIAQEDPKRTEFVYNGLNQLVAEFHDTQFPIEERLAVPVLIGLFFSLPLWWLGRRRQFMPFMLVIPFVAIPLFQQQTPATIVYEYDLNGNMVRVVDNTDNTKPKELLLSYDSFNRLVNMQGEKAGTEREEPINIRVVYDAMGRVAEMYRGETESFSFIYDAYGLLAIRDLSNNNEQIFFSPFAGETMLIQQANDLTWPALDSLGTARRLVNTDGSLNDTGSIGFNSNAFGETINPYGAVAENDNPQLLFLGQLYEPQTGFYWMGARIYDPRLGRFIQRDPVRHDPQGNLYTYAYNRPTSLVDTSGFTPEVAFEGIAPDVPQIDPLQTIPGPSLPEIVEVPSVYRQQATENHRILRLAHETRFHMNEVTFALADAACDLYIYDVNPATSELYNQLTITSEAMLGLYNQENAWLPASMPQINGLDEPITALEDILPILALASDDFQPLSGCSRSFALPQIPQPQMTLSDVTRRADFTELLAEIPLFSVVASELPYLQEIDTILPAQALPEMQVESLAPMVLPPLSGQLGDLQEESLKFFSELLLPKFDS